MSSYTSAKVLVQNRLAGILSKTGDGYSFIYDDEYLNDHPLAVSLTLPLAQKSYESGVLFPFFDGLIPEGWLLSAVRKHWNIPETDRFEVLLRACHDPIGDVQIIPIEEANHE